MLDCGPWLACCTRWRRALASSCETKATSTASRQPGATVQALECAACGIARRARHGLPAAPGARARSRDPCTSAGQPAGEPRLALARRRAGGAPAPADQPGARADHALHKPGRQAAPRAAAHTRRIATRGPVHGGGGPERGAGVCAPARGCPGGHAPGAATAARHRCRPDARHHPPRHGERTPYSVRAGSAGDTRM